MKYPDITDDEFYDKINNIYKDYKIPKKKKTLDDICFPKKFELQNSQKLLGNYINPKTPYTGILVYHRIGAGKTCTAVQIGEVWKKHRRVIVVVPASLKGNFRNELRSQCAGTNYLTDEERKLLSENHPSTKEYQDIIKRSDERINEYYEIFSYNKFIDLAQNKEINLKNAILIIDEIQNMISEEGTYYNVLYDLIQKSPKDLRVVLLSATPMFDKPHELALTINLLRPKKEIPIGRDFDKKYVKILKNNDGTFEYKARHLCQFKEQIKGLISYFRGAPPYVFPDMKIKYVKCRMSEFQYSAYKGVLRNEAKQSNFEKIKKEAIESLSVTKLPNNFFIGTRFVSNVVYPNRKIGEEGLKSFKGKKILDDLEEYSCKFAKIMKKIQGSKGKVFVYSGFKEEGGIKSFARVLETFGYKNYVKHGEGRKRFAIWSGDEDISLKEEIKNVYNQKSNLDGSKLKILILSPAAKEGISLAGVRQAHILEPYWNMARLQQIIGRGSRFCSHKDLPEDMRNIKVYIYLATHPDEEETVDEYINHLADQKNKLVNEFEKAIKESAIDCSLFKNANYYPELGDENFTCED
jgi:superfamily II DNA or RNA helicase